MTNLGILGRIRLIPARRWKIRLDQEPSVSASEHSIRATTDGLLATWKWVHHHLDLKLGPEVVATLDGIALPNHEVRGTLGTEGKWWQCHFIISVRSAGGNIRLAGRIW
ncbi:MAG: hypothetical protein JNK63_03805 [Chthonomonas sp.]|nr:hypothetical protein [Chthonomonas sp.]